jgi:hypothetical protein
VFVVCHLVNKNVPNFDQPVVPQQWLRDSTHTRWLVLDCWYYRAAKSPTSWTETWCAFQQRIL